jgi:hypothetical protein
MSYYKINTLEEYFKHYKNQFVNQKILGQLPETLLGTKNGIKWLILIWPKPK